MPFVLRGQEDTDNPYLPELRGYGATHGRLAYYAKEGTVTKFILLLARGICDGIDWYEYQGIRLPEYNPATGVGNWVFHPGTLTRRKDPADPAHTGFNDPLQGRPAFFPELNFTFSGIAYIEVRLPADLSEGEGAPQESQIRMRGLRIPDFNPDGSEMAGPGPDSEGRPLWQVPGTGRWVSFTCNPARHAVDVLKQGRVKVPQRVNWPSAVEFRARSNFGIGWVGGGGDGLLASYYNNTDFGGAPVAQAVEPVLNKQLSYTAPAAGVGAENYTIRFAGQFEAPADGAITFYSTHDDAARLYVGGAQVINDWAGGAARTRSGTFNGAVKGQRYDITYEYRQDTSFGELRLEWEAAGVGRQVVPQSNLFSSSAAAPRSVPRYECDVAFTQPVAASQAFGIIMDFCPGVEWQDVNGRIKFLTDPAREPVYHFVWDDTQPSPRIASNIVKDSFSAQRRDPTLLPNYLRGSYRDKDTDQFTKKWTQVDRPEVRRQQGGKDNSPTPMEFGVMRQSLAERILETYARLNIDLDLQVTLKGLPMCYKVAKGDIVRVTHNVPRWRVLGPVLLFMVVRETFDSPIDTADERSFILRLHSPEYYSDTSHGPIARFQLTADPIARAAAPPPVTAVSFVEVLQRASDDTVASALQGTAQFDTSYPHEQYAWVYWQPPGGQMRPVQRIKADPTSRQASFSLSPAASGQHFVKVVTETRLGRKLPDDSHPLFGWTIIGDTSAPEPPPSGAMQYDGGAGIDITWAESPSPNRGYYEVRAEDAADGGLGTLLQSVPRRATGGNFWKMPVAPGLTDYAVRVYTISSSGRRSLTPLHLTTSLPATAAPAGYSLSFVDGTTIRHSIAAPLAGHTYDFSATGVGALVSGTAGQWDETSFPVTPGQRTFTRYARAVKHGLPSAWAPASLTVQPPPAPVILRDPDFTFPSSFVLRVTGPADLEQRKRIRSTVAQVYANAALTQTVGEPQRYDGLQETVRIDGRQSTRPQVWVRVWFEDLFGAGSPSNTESGNFTQFLGSDIGPGVIGDAHIDTSSSLARRISAQNTSPVMASGDVSWDGTLFVTSKRLLAIPVPQTVASAGYLNFGAAATPSAYNLTAATGWGALIFRVQVGGAGGDADNHAYDAASNKGWFVTDYQTYQPANPTTSARMDFTIAVRNADTGSLHLWNNIVLKPTGQPVRAGGVIQDGGVGTLQLINGAVERAKIALAAVDPDRIQGAVYQNLVVGGATVLRAVIDWLAVREANIVDASIVNAKIANAAVDYAKIQNAVLQLVTIGGASVERAFIDWLAVREANIVDAVVTRAKIALLAVDNARIADAAIDMAKVNTLDVGVYSPWNPATATGSGMRFDATGWHVNTSTAAFVQGVPFTVVNVRATNAITQFLTWRGRDTRTLDTTKRTFYGRVNDQIDYENDIVRARVFCNFDGLVTAASNVSDIHGDSLRWCRFEVFDKFGNRKDYNYWPYTGRGVCADASFGRRDADLASEAVWKLTFWNAYGWTPDTDALWLYPDNTMAYVAPTWRSAAACPRDLRATTRSGSEVALSWQWNGAARAVWARNVSAGGAWVDVTAQCAGDRIASCVVTGLSPATRYDFRVNDGSGGAGGNNSNVTSERTFPVAAAPPRPAPSQPTGVALDTSAVRFTWARNASDNSAADYAVDTGGGFGAWTQLPAADSQSADIGGLAPSQAVSLKVRNRWADSTTAESGVGSGRSAAAPPSNTNPANLQITVNMVNVNNVARAAFTWALNAGVNPTLHVRRLYDGLTFDYNPTQTPTSHNTGYALEGGAEYEAWVTTANGTQPSNVVPFTAAARTPTHDDPWCLAPETEVDVLAAGRVVRVSAERLLAMRRLGVRLPQAVWQDAEGRVFGTDIIAVDEGRAPAMQHVTTARGYAVSVSPSHPCLSTAADAVGRPAEQLREGSLVVVREADGRPALDRVRVNRREEGEARVIMLSLAGPEHRFWAGGVGSHNMKPRMEML